MGGGARLGAKASAIRLDPFGPGSERDPAGTPVRPGFTPQSFTREPRQERKKVLELRAQAISPRTRSSPGERFRRVLPRLACSDSGSRCTDTVLYLILV